MLGTAPLRRRTRPVKKPSRLLRRPARKSKRVPRKWNSIRVVVTAPKDVRTPAGHQVLTEKAKSRRPFSGLPVLAFRVDSGARFPNSWATATLFGPMAQGPPQLSAPGAGYTLGRLSACAKQPLTFCFFHFLHRTLLQRSIAAFLSPVNASGGRCIRL